MPLVSTCCVLRAVLLGTTLCWAVAWGQSPAGPLSLPASACSALQPAAVLAQVNAWREQGARCGAQGGLAPAAALGWSPQLQAMAETQARWMADFGALVHRGRGGETLVQRAQAAGYAYGRIGENLAHGQRDLAQALAGWTASESHCLNLYDSRVTEMGLACVPGRDGRPFWAMLTGRPAAPLSRLLLPWPPPSLPSPPAASAPAQ